MYFALAALATNLILANGEPNFNCNTPLFSSTTRVQSKELDSDYFPDCRNQLWYRLGILGRKQQMQLGRVVFLCKEARLAVRATLHDVQRDFVKMNVRATGQV